MPAVNSTRTHDVILGDLGRDAAIRLVQMCSRLERTKISSLLPKNALFRDEHRYWSFELHCDIASFKPEITDLPKFQEIPNRYLVGFGYNPRKLAKNLIGYARRRFKTLEAHSRCRLVIPCNTMQTEVPFIKSELVDVRPGIDVIGPATAVVSRLDRNRREVTIMPIGTELAIEGYRQACEKSEFVTVVAPSPTTVRDLKDLIQESVSGSLGEETISRFLSSVQKESQDATILGACTDFDFPVGLDSLAEMSSFLIDSTYAGLGG